MDMKTKRMSGTAVRPVGLIIRQKDPNNLEMPFDQLGDFITPAEYAVISPRRSWIPSPIGCR
jgi:hypothetical protein